MSEHYDVTDVPPDRSVKVAHLVFGLFFLGVAAIWALVSADVITVDRLAVLAPIVLITAGVVGLAASLANARNRRRRLAHARATAPSYDEGVTTDPSNDPHTDHSNDHRTTDDTEELR